MKTLKQQTSDILNSKIKRIAQSCWLKANPNWQKSKKHNPYTLPAEVDLMIEMLGKIETATNDELESFVNFATTGGVFEMTTK